MKQVPLTAKVRTTKGSNIARRSRAQGVVPAEIYGHKSENQSIEVSEKEFVKIISSAKGENIFFALSIEGGKTAGPILAVVKEIQYDKVSNLVLHADFHQVNMKEKIKIKVPVRVLNGDTCEGVKAGGVLQLAMRTVEVQCLPTEVPESISVDAAHLAIGSAVHVSDLKLPEGVKAVQYAGSVVVSVAQQMAEEVKAAPTAEGVAAATAAPGAAAEPEVLTAKKKEDGAEAAKAGEKKPAEKK
jgi:large subunit ribosomal protein L25